ncbi:MAG: ABC transporter ATP-binding protein [Nitrosospira sp.]|nr:ABC transporter ATP-binding protein [Nitrosospira sp.]
MALLEIRGVTRCFGNFIAVNNISISIETGEFFTLLGPSGCGKTTLLRMIAGFDLPDSGQILLDGKDMVGMPSEKRPIHTVFQTYALFPHMTVSDNVAFPLKIAGKKLDEIRSRVIKTLDDVRLFNLGNRFPHELSGGQRQRVALARGLISRPRLLLLDEPLGALDLKLREEMQIELINLQKETGIAFVFVTHSQNEALTLSHRIVVMNQGGVEQIDTPSKIYNFPRNRFVADFLGKINIMDAQVLEIIPPYLRLLIPELGQVVIPNKEGVKIGDKGFMAIRPEQMRIMIYSEEVNSKNHFSGQIKSLLYAGDVTIYVVEFSNGTRVEILLPNSAPREIKRFEIGDLVVIVWESDVGLFLND